MKPSITSIFSLSSSGDQNFDLCLAAIIWFILLKHSTLVELLLSNLFSSSPSDCFLSKNFSLFDSLRERYSLSSMSSVMVGSLVLYLSILIGSRMGFNSSISIPLYMFSSASLFAFATVLSFVTILFSLDTLLNGNFTSAVIMGWSDTASGGLVIVIFSIGPLKW